MNMNHIHLGTKDLSKSQAFYEKYFGFRKKFDHGKGVFLVNDHSFLIAIDPVDQLPEFPEWYHIGFCLDNEAQVLSLYDQMKADSVMIAGDMMKEAGEFASFYIRDPDGNKIEISWHNE